MKNVKWLNDEQSTEQETLVEERIESSNFNPFVEDGDDNPHALITQLKADESDTRKTAFFDYLWAFIPLLVLLPLLHTLLQILMYGNGDNIESNFFYPNLIVALATIIFVIVGVRRKSDILQAHWLGRIPAYALATLPFLYGGSFPFSMPVWVSGIGAILMTGSLGWLGRLIYKNRRDHLKVAFMFLPILMLILNFSTNLLMGRMVDMDVLTSWSLTMNAIKMIGWGIGLGLFFLGRNRRTKWIGIFTPFLFAFLGSLFVTGLIPTTASLWLVVPALLWLVGLTIPIFFYWRERRNRPKEKQPDDLDTAAPSPA